MASVSAPPALGVFEAPASGSARSFPGPSPCIRFWTTTAHTANRRHGGVCLAVWPSWERPSPNLRGLGTPSRRLSSGRPARRRLFAETGPLPESGGTSPTRLHPTQKVGPAICGTLHWGSAFGGEVHERFMFVASVTTNLSQRIYRQLVRRPLR